MSWTAPLPPTRTTSGPGEPAVDVNTLTNAITEVRGRIEDQDIIVADALDLAATAHVESEAALEQAQIATELVDGKLDETDAALQYVQVGGAVGMKIWPPSVEDPETLDGWTEGDGQLWMSLP